MGGSQGNTKREDRGVPPRKILQPFHFSERILKLAEKQVAVGYEISNLRTELCERRLSEGCTFDGTSPLDEDAICRESPATRRMYKKYNRLVKKDREMGKHLQELVSEEKADEIVELRKKEKDTQVVGKQS